MQPHTELPTDLEILPLEPSDLPDALSLQKMAFMTEAIRYDDYRLSPLEERFAAFAQEVQVKTFLQARLEGGIVGLIRGFVRDGTGFVERLSVHPAHRGRGIGAALVRALEAALGTPRFELFTAQRSADNIRLYESLGYRCFNQRSRDASIPLVLMEKS